MKADSTTNGVALVCHWPKDKAYFNLGRWGWPVNLIALAYGVFMIINLSWPRTPGAAWYDNYIVAVSIGAVLIVGIIVYFIQRARGIDPSATIHEIGESPVEAQAGLAMAAGEAGKVLPVDTGAILPHDAGISEMSGPEGPGAPGPGGYID
jgi:hypothetical protein